MTAAQFITASEPLDTAPIFSRTVNLDQGHGAVLGADITLTALGVIEGYIDGVPVSDHVLTPGWTSYEWRIRTVTHDVTKLLRDGSSVSLLVGNGWWRGRLGWARQNALYGSEIAGYALLAIRFEDGHVQRIGTDDQWTVTGSRVVSNDLYDGEHIDLRLSKGNTTKPGGAVRVIDVDPAKLSPSPLPPARRQDALAPQRVWTTPAGATLVDFGQNIVGWLRLRVRGPRGSRVILRHAEVLENDELGVRPLRSAEATDSFILTGDDDVLEPSLTFHGFRYAQVDGWPDDAPELSAENIAAIVVHNDMHPTGTFRCSDPELTRLHENIRWSVKGNFLSIPMDCPQRDERLGWTGDISVFAPTAAFLFDVNAFLSEWLVDVSLEQADNNGIVPIVVPDVIKLMGITDEHFPKPATTAIWGDASVWVPWALYMAYGDTSVLQRQLPSMLAHGRRIQALLSDSGLWDTGFQFGDWLDPDSPPAEPWNSKADRGVVATACAYRTATTLRSAARALGLGEEETEFADMAAGLRQAFVEHYVAADGTIVSDCATVYALAITFGLLNDDDRERAGNRLAALVRAENYRISTGFAGTPYITDALTISGHLEEAYGLLMRRECPSWLYPVTMGATTVWERWDSMLPDGSINPGEMTSFNHYALGSIADWIHRTVGGIEPLEPAYRRVLIAPRPGGGLEWAETSLETGRGMLAVHWSLVDERLELRVTVPEGTVAEIRVFGLETEVRGGEHRFTTMFGASID